MISVQEAESIVNNRWHGHSQSLGTETFLVSDPQTFVSREPILSDRPYPPFNRAMMDGICVDYETYHSGKREFALSGVCSAGSPAQRLQDPHKAMEIMTGAPLPEGADLVIRYEDLEIQNGRAKITAENKRERFDNVHLKGSDCKAGEVILPEGLNFNGPRWGIAASFGYEKIRGQRMPKIKIISTGDEVVPVGKTPLNYQIRVSNAAALKASLLLHGYKDVDLDHVSDSKDLISENYLRNASAHDVLIYTGGVSQGKFDYLPQIWEELGVKKLFHGVAQRPGKPLWFGTDLERRTTVFGLPGNPVSCLICLHRYFLPQRKLFARLSEEVEFSVDKTLFLPVKTLMREDGSLWATPVEMQNSGAFTALAESEGFLELPAQKTAYIAGKAFRFFSWLPMGDAP